MSSSAGKCQPDVTDVSRPLASWNMAGQSGEVGRKPHRRRRRSAHSQIHTTLTFAAQWELAVGHRLGWHPAGHDVAKNTKLMEPRFPSQIHHVATIAETQTLDESHATLCLEDIRMRAGRGLSASGREGDSIKSMAEFEKDARQANSSAATKGDPFGKLYKRVGHRQVRVNQFVRQVHHQQFVRRPLRQHSSRNDLH